jgi:hypothetical protein
MNERLGVWVAIASSAAGGAAAVATTERAVRAYPR